jgi:hypothetical protein
MRELPDDKLPCHGSGKGGLEVQCPKKGNGSRPSRFKRAGIRSDARQVVLLGGCEPPVGRSAPCYLRDLGGHSVIHRVAQHQQQGRPAPAHHLFQCQRRFPGNSSNMHI